MNFSYFQISTLITAFVGFFFGVLVYSREKKSKTNLFWLLTSIAISAWSIGLFGVVFSEKKESAWFWQYVLDIGGIATPILYFNFVLFLIKKKAYKTRAFSFLIGVILVILNFTDLFKKGVSSKFGLNYWIDPGPLYFLFPAFFIFFVISTTFYIIKKHKRTSEKIVKKQLEYLLFAQLFGFGGGFTNFFPQLFNVYPFGNYLVILYVVFISYAAAKHHLFNIRVIVTELLTFALIVFLLVKTAFSETYQELIINGGILVGVLIVGGLLVRSVLREVKQREKVEQMAKALQEAYEVEKKAHKELEGLSEAKNQFIMATQHHLRTPLTSMIGYIDLILSGTYGKVSPKMKTAILKLQTSTKRLIRIVNEILDISQFQLGKQVVDLQPGIDMEAIIDEIVEELSFEAKSKDIYLKLRKPKRGLPKVRADEEKIKVALFNLVDNAVKYTTEGGVTLEIKTIDHSLRVVTKDTGIGIAEENLPNLFEKIFERGEKAKEVFATGKGIGLFISSRIIKAHNGKVWAESEGKGKGSTFFVELPIK